MEPLGRAEAGSLIPTPHHRDDLIPCHPLNPKPLNPKPKDYFTQERFKLLAQRCRAWKLHGLQQIVRTVVSCQPGPFL